MIPVKGVIGSDFTSAKMQSLLAGAQKANAEIVILEIDTPGGSVEEAEKIIDQIIATRDRRFVALVHKALSAGAAIALACKDIYMTESATIGAATSYLRGPDGMPLAMPADVAEKMQSAWRAVCRKAADTGGHDSLLAEGMVDPDFALTMDRTGEGPVVLTRVPKGVIPRGRILKEQGRILTLTAKEAVECGLARSSVPDLAQLGRALGIERIVGAQGGSAPQSGPVPWYDVLTQKAKALGLMEENLTDVQKAQALKMWDSWYQQEAPKFIGTNVQWTLALAKATSPMSPAELARLRSMLAEAQNSLSAPTRSGETGLTPAQRKSRQESVTTLQHAINRGTQITIAASPRGNERVVIDAGLDPRFEQYVASVPVGQDIVISGKVASVTFWSPAGFSVLRRDPSGAPTRGLMVPPNPVKTDWPSHPKFWVTIELEQCSGGELADAPSLPRAKPTTGPQVPEDRAAQLLRLAASYRGAGSEDKAREILRSIVRDFPDTKAGQEARKQLEASTRPAGPPSAASRSVTVATPHSVDR